MKLYGSYASPFVRHARIALMQGNFEFEFIEVDASISAEQSPTGKVPYFSDGDLKLTDSCAIVKYIREKSGRTYLEDINDFELFTMVNTLLDATINMFLLEKEGFNADTIAYLGRHQRRIENGLKELNMRFSPQQGIGLDSALRCSCFIDWALFRNRITLDGLDNLKELLEVANTVPEFTATAPPR